MFLPFYYLVLKQDPQPFGKWDGVRDALKDGNKCKQGILVRNTGADPKNIAEVGDEDCLFLCVHTEKVIVKQTFNMK